MQAGELIAGEVMTYTSRVLVNGIARPVLSWSRGQDLVGDLPEQVVAGGGVAHASGSIVWAGERDVETGELNPWNPSTGWIPTSGDRVQIFAGDGTSEWSQFVGVIDTSSGEIGGGMSSTIIDKIDDFSRVVSVTALVTDMPPFQDGGEFLHVGVTTVFHADMAFRAAGYYATPRREFGAVLDLPLQGSAWPHIGITRICGRSSNSNMAPIDYRASWGRCFGDMQASYEPASPRSGSQPVQVTFMVGPNHQNSSYVRCYYGSKTLELRAANGNREAFVNGTRVAVISAPASTVVQALFKNGTVELRANTGQSATGTAVLGTTELMSQVMVYAHPDARIAGIQVSHPDSPAREFASIGFTPTAIIEAGHLHGTASAAPAFTNMPARDLLDAYSKALLRPMWIDETGIAKSIASDILRAQPPVRTLTTLDDIRELSWERSLLGVRSEVRASYQFPAVSASRVPSLTAWENTSSETLANGDTREFVIEPPSGSDWIMLDTIFTIPGFNAVDDMNRGIGSVAGGVYTNGVDEQWAPPAGKMTVGLEKISATMWVATLKAQNVAPGWQVEPRTWSSQFSGNTGLWPYWWDKLMPIMRCKALIQWSGMTRTPSIAGTRGPVLEHDFGYWAASRYQTDVIDAITSYIAEQVTSPQATITSLRVGFDPRLQLGDVVTIESQAFMGVSLRCLIVGMETGFSGSYAQGLSVRIISASTSFTTYGQFAEAWGSNADFESFATAWDAISSYANLNSDPLRGT